MILPEITPEMEETIRRAIAARSTDVLVDSYRIQISGKFLNHVSDLKLWIWIVGFVFSSIDMDWIRFLFGSLELILSEKGREKLCFNT